MGIYDAFETKEDAKRAAKDLGSYFGKPKVKKLKGKQRLQYGVFAPKY